MSEKKYIAFPGDIRSKRDGQVHHIGFGRLCELHCVNPAEAIDGSRREQVACRDIKHLKPLHISPSGNYPLFDRNGVDCPNCNRPAPGGLYSHENQPKEFGEAKWSLLHCGCYHEPKGGERFTTDKDSR